MEVFRVLDITEIHKYLKMVDGWEVKSGEDKIYYLIKNFKFKKFYRKPAICK